MRWLTRVRLTLHLCRSLRETIHVFKFYSISCFIHPPTAARLLSVRVSPPCGAGLQAAIARAKAYIEAGADALFPEALTTLEEYKAFHAALPDVPILANITEFGKTPLFTAKQLGDVGVSMVLYPLSAFRAMSASALNVYETILKEGTQAPCIPQMQTRESLYKFLDYHRFENELDRLFGKGS